MIVILLYFTCVTYNTPDFTSTKGSDTLSVDTVLQDLRLQSILSDQILFVWRKTMQKTKYNKKKNYF